MNRVRLYFVSILAFLALIGVVIAASLHYTTVPEVGFSTTWEFQSIDTMKYSRDTAREKGKDIEFDNVIDQQMQDIAAAGATHVGIATPYDEEFLPYLRRWVTSARNHGLKIWYRGNWSGWEGWFEYPKISRSEHTEKTIQFILDNPELFYDGDAFSGCPECENGGPGDPRLNGDVEGHRAFIIREYQETQQAFAKIGKKVVNNYFSMNGDVARLIMDKPTTQAVGGIVTIDHYVASPEKLVSDINDIAEKSGGKVVLGEFGAPIPDIHGQMSEKEQADYLERTLSLLVGTPNLVGVNYWVSVGGSTQLWDGNGKDRLAVLPLQAYFKPKIIAGRITNEIGSPIANAKVTLNDYQTTTNTDGSYRLLSFKDSGEISVIVPGYVDQTLFMNNNVNEFSMRLKKLDESMIFKVIKFIRFSLPFLP